MNSISKVGLGALLAGLCVSSFAAEEGVRVSERFGYDPADSTKCLQAALDSGLQRIVLDRQASPWIARPLKGRSNQTIVIPEGVELVAKRGEFHRASDMLLSFSCATNVVLTGGGTIRMWFEDYTNKNLYAWSEWRHAVATFSCANVTIENLRIADSGGDGIYLGSRKPCWPNRNVTIRDVVLSRHNRQGISVISADRLLIERCTMADTCGTPPMAGIDFEPNCCDEWLKDIVVRDSVVRGNWGAGFDFSVGNLGAKAAPISILLENCRSEGNRHPTKFHHATNPMRNFSGAVLFRNCTFNDADGRRTTFRAPDGPETMSVAFENCRAADPDRGGALTPLGPEYGWTRLATPTWKDGSPMTVEDVSPASLARVTVVDTAPGKAVRLPRLALRGAMTYLAHAAEKGRVVFKGVIRKIGKSDFRGCRMSVETADGKTVMRAKSLDCAFDREFELAFEAPAPGFYRLTCEVGPHVLCLTETTVPVAAVAETRKGTLPGWNGFEGEAFLRVPKGCRHFAVAACGGGGNERVRAILEDPMGRRAWDCDNVGSVRIWSSDEEPSPGVWRIVSKRPGKGCLDDYSFDVYGLPAQLFLCKEKTWE